jgi:hypothetical protein
VGLGVAGFSGVSAKVRNMDRSIIIILSVHRPET